MTGRADDKMLSLAVEYGHVEAIELLVSKGAQLQYELIAHSVIGGHVAVCEWLLDAQADVNYSPPGRRPPLAVAAFYGKPDVVKTLMQYNADPHFGGTSSNGSRLAAGPLHLAARAGHLGAIDALVQ